MTPEQSTRWSTVLSLVVVVLLIGGISMVVLGRVRPSPVELLGISLLVAVLGFALRAGPLRGLGTTLVLLGVVLVLLVVGRMVFVLVFYGLAVGY